METTTIEQWKKRSHARWDIHGYDATEEGLVKIKFIYRANHHAEFTEFVGKEAAEAKRIWEIGRLRSKIESKEWELSSLRAELSQLETP